MLKHGKVDIKLESFMMRFLSIRAIEASKSDFSRVAKSVYSTHRIVAALGFYIIRANSPNDLPASSIATCLMLF